MARWFRWLDPIVNPLACLPPVAEPPAVDHADALLRRLEALLKQPLSQSLSGDKRGVLYGSGLDFADLREYVPGDDIRKLDWNVFARTLTPHVREYHEEKQLTVWLMLDATPSMQFGRQRSKWMHAVELAGLLGLMAQQAGHRLGAMIVDVQGTVILPPQMGENHLLHVLQLCLQRVGAQPPSSGAPVAGVSADLLSDPLGRAARELAQVVGKQSTVFLISDFWSAQTDWLAVLGGLSRRARLYSLWCRDVVEATLPEGLPGFWVRDPEQGTLAWLDGVDARFRARYAQRYQEECVQRESWLVQVSQVVVSDTADSPVATVLELLRLRRKAG